MPPVPLGQRFNYGHQTSSCGISLYPVPPNSKFYRSVTQLPLSGNLWVDCSNTIEDARLASQPFHGGDIRPLTAYSYDRRVPPGTYVEPKVFNLATHPKWRTQPSLTRLAKAKLLREARSFSVPRRGGGGSPYTCTNELHNGPVSCIFLGFADWTMEPGRMTRGELDRLMISACRSKYPCSRPATYEELISQAIIGLPEHNKTGLDIAFVGPGSEVIPAGGGGIESRSAFCRKKVVFPGDRLDKETSLSLNSLGGRKTCIAVQQLNRLSLQPSLRQFGAARKTLSGVNGEGSSKAYTTSCRDQVGDTHWKNAFPFPHLLTESSHV